MLKAVYTMWHQYKRVVLLIAVMILLVITSIVVSDYLTHYKRQGTVVEKYQSYVVIEDERGNLWEYEDERLEEGQSVTMKMFTNGTDIIITDDVITELIINN